jgi:hypothetical protein
VRPEFFAYKSGLYSALAPTTGGVFPIGSRAGPSGDMADVLGVLDVTIIEWGQNKETLSEDQVAGTAMYNRW